MTDHHENDRTAARLRAALTAAADVMVVDEVPVREHVTVRRARVWLLPLTAAASVVVTVLASLIVVHLASPSGTHSAGTHSTGTQGATGSTAQVPPEYYMTAIYPSTGPNVLQFQVRRTDGGAVTASTSIPAANVGWGGTLTAAAGDRTFFIAHYPCTSTAVPVTTFYRITITGSGQISSDTPAGPPVQGMVTDLAVSPDGTQMAYNALPGKCASGTGFKSAAASAVSIVDLSTGAVRTWQDTTQPNTTGPAMVGGLSWAPDGRTLIIDERSRGAAASALTVYGLDTTSSGGSLQADSTTLLQQNSNCSTCVTTALAGPDGSLTALEYQVVGQQVRILVVRISSAAGSPQTVLYSEVTDTVVAANSDGLFADSSGQWVFLWPTGGASGPNGKQIVVPVGWISGGQLHPMPGVGRVFPEGVAW